MLALWAEQRETYQFRIYPYFCSCLVIADGHMISDDTPANILTNREISDRAYLKQTSLYDMAEKCGILAPSEFVECFINYERTVR